MVKEHIYKEDKIVGVRRNYASGRKCKKSAFCKVYITICRK